MSVHRLQEIENRLDRLEEECYEELRELKQHLQKESKQNQMIQDEMDTLGSLQMKVEYLTSVNEHLVRQNQHLREYIEEGLEKGEIKDKKGYFAALRGDR